MILQEGGGHDGTCVFLPCDLYRCFFTWFLGRNKNESLDVDIVNELSINNGLILVDISDMHSLKTNVAPENRPSTQKK